MSLLTDFKKRNAYLVAVLAPMGLLILLLLGATVYLTLSGFRDLRPIAARVVSHLIRRQLTVNGSFSIDPGTVFTVHATNVRLSNPPWATSPFMAEVGTLSVAINLRSLWRHPVRLISIKGWDVAVNLERGPDGKNNWQFGKPKSNKLRTKKKKPVLIDEIAWENAKVDYLNPRGRNQSHIILQVNNGKLRRKEDDSYQLEKARLSWGKNNLDLHGVLGKLPSLIGTDLTVTGSGPDVSPLAAMLAINLPEQSYTIKGRIERMENGYRFHDFLFESGKYHLSMKGSLGKPPRFTDTDFRIAAKGPFLSLISRLLGWRELPDQAFAMSGYFQGNPRRFKAENFKVQLGESDLRGNFNVDLGKTPPYFQGDLRSHAIDLSWLAENFGQDETAAEIADEPAKSEQPTLLISEKPFEFSALKKIDGQLRWQANVFKTEKLQLEKPQLEGQLENGSLRINHVEGGRGNGEVFHGSFTLEPSPPGYQIETHFLGEQLRLAAWGGPVETRPPISIDLEFAGRGNSPHQLLLHGQGKLYVNAGAGTMASRLSDKLAKPTLKKIAQTLNPIAKTKKTEQFKCAVVAAHINGGEARLDALAMQTENLTMLGSGKIRLRDERLDFEWAAKPRKGVGLSPGSIAEPYVKIGGTLSEPSLDIKPLSAGVSTGLAVVTFGLSILAKGMWDRLSAESDVCGDVNKRYGPSGK